MRIQRLLWTLAVSIPLALSGSAAGSATTTDRLRLSEFTVDHDAMCEIRDEWVEDILATHEAGTWAKMEFHPNDSQLARMGLPSADVLTSRRYSKPTIVTKDGRFVELSMGEFNAAMAQGNGKGNGGGKGGNGGTQASDPALASFAGTGCLGIRPGAFLLLLTGGGVGWCSAAHVYGSPGSYDISTAGHCGGNGDVATVIAAVGNRGGAAGPVLLDFGTFTGSVDGGLGNDYAKIDNYSQYQNLVTPTMCFWGGPRGVYTKTGAVAQFTYQGGFPSGVSVTPDPLLAQTIVHYGHGTGVGTGGTPRAGETIHWGSSHFMFFGAISPGDSGSGGNTLAGDTVGANMEAAGIMTHLYVDPLMRQGFGIMGGTRTTKVGTPANGQIVPYPVPVDGLP
jgi:hypothetical protein